MKALVNDSYTRPKPSNGIQALFTRLASLACLALTLNAPPALADNGDAYASTRHSRAFSVDIAENPFRFSFDTNGPLLENGLPAYGNPFITQGYIYPAGTLDKGVVGIDSEGNPAFPELVIGEWTCRGYLVGEGANTVTGPIVNSTQTYDFYEQPGYESGKASGARNIVSVGYELADVGVPVKRAITGGTGPFRLSRGEAEQQLLGVSELMGVALRIKLNIHRR
jgi:hypothetical protein